MPSMPADDLPLMVCIQPPMHAHPVRARQRLEDAGPVAEALPVDAARQRASEITGQVAGMMEHLGGQLTSLLEELRTVSDPEAVEAQIESMTTEAADRVAAANARASRAEQAQRRAEAERQDQARSLPRVPTTRTCR